MYTYVRVAVYPCTRGNLCTRAPVQPCKSAEDCVIDTSKNGIADHSYDHTPPNRPLAPYIQQARLLCRIGVVRG